MSKYNVVTLGNCLSITINTLHCVLIALTVMLNFTFYNEDGVVCGMRRSGRSWV